MRVDTGGNGDLGELARLAGVAHVDDGRAVRRRHVGDVRDAAAHHDLTAARTIEVPDRFDAAGSAHDVSSPNRCSARHASRPSRSRAYSTRPPRYVGRPHRPGAAGFGRRRRIRRSEGRRPMPPCAVFDVLEVTDQAKMGQCRQGVLAA